MSCTQDKLSIDVLVGRHVEIDENKGVVGTLEMKRACPRRFCTVSHRVPVQLESRRLDCYKDTEQKGSRKSCVEFKLATFSKEKKSTRGESPIAFSALRP